MQLVIKRDGFLGGLHSVAFEIIAREVELKKLLSDKDATTTEKDATLTERDAVIGELEELIASSFGKGHEVKHLEMQLTLVTAER